MAADSRIAWLRATANIVDPGNAGMRNDNESGYMARIADGIAVLTASPAVTQAQLDDVKTAMPQPATTAPPPVTIDSAKGTAPRYALEDHTHESRLQARRIQVTPDANGRVVYVYPKAYPAGVVPIPTATAETPAGVMYRHDVSILEGSTTNTQTTLVITRQNQSITTGLLGAVLAIFSPVTTPVWINVISRAPSAA